MERRIPEPCAPVRRTLHSPFFSSSIPRWYSVRPGFLRIAVSAFARRSGRAGLVRPIIVSNAPRAKGEKGTMTATGVPGGAKRDADFSRGRGGAEGIGRPGRQAVFQNA